VSVALGLAALAAGPAGVAVARYSVRVGLVEAMGGAVGAAALLGLGAILLARRARRRIERTLWRARGRNVARVGRALGFLGVCLAITGGLGLGFFGLLEWFAR
jgi:hypothetical protein